MVPTKVKDRVCNKEIFPSRSAGSEEYEGLTYYFCSNECREKFNQRPRQYITVQTVEMPSSKRGRKRSVLVPSDLVDQQEERVSVPADEEPEELDWS